MLKIGQLIQCRAKTSSWCYSGSLSGKILLAPEWLAEVGRCTQVSSGLEGPRGPFVLFPTLSALSKPRFPVYMTYLKTLKTA